MSRLVSSTQQVGIGREYEYLSKGLYFYKTCKVGLLTCFAICLILDSQRDGSAQGVCELQKILRIIAGIRSGEIAFTLGKRFPKSCAFVKTRAPLGVIRGTSGCYFSKSLKYPRVSLANPS